MENTGNNSNTNIGTVFSNNTDDSIKNAGTGIKKDANVPVKKNRMMETVRKYGEKLIGIFKDYPVTIIAIVIAALIGAILEEYNSTTAIIDDDDLIKAAGFLLILSVQALFLEEHFPKKLLPRIIGYVLSCCFSAAYIGILSSQKEFIFGYEAERICLNVAKILTLHLVILFCLTIKHMFIRLEEDFEAYVSKSLLELIKATVIYGLFAIGLGIIISIFNELIFDTDDFVWQLELFLAGGIYTPMCIKSIARKNEEPGKFARVCFLYVLQPMLLISFVIIYIYIIKLIILKEILSNSIFGILAFLFCSGAFIWTVVHTMKQKEGFFSKLTTILPYIFIPFLILQCWAISLRINDYGITPERYFCIVLLIAEITYFILYVLHQKGHKRSISNMLFFIMIMTFIITFVPGINIEDAVIGSQIKRIRIMLENPDEYGSSLSSAYGVVYRTGYKGKDKLEETFTESEIETMKQNSEYDHDVYKMVYINGSNLRYDVIDVSDYNSICYIETYNDYEIMDGKIYLDPSSTQDPDIVLDITDYLEDIMNKYNSKNHFEFELKDNNIIETDNDTVLYVTYLSMSYNKENKDIEYLNLNGYVMNK